MIRLERQRRRVRAMNIGMLTARVYTALEQEGQTRGELQDSPSGGQCFGEASAARAKDGILAK